MRKRLVALAASAAMIGVGMLGLAPAAHADEHHGCEWVNIIVGTPSPDVIPGTRNCDLIFGFGGNDRISGNGGEDTLRGGRGNDRLNGIDVFGFPEADLLKGGRGFDSCVGDQFDTYEGCEVVDILT